MSRLLDTRYKMPAETRKIGGKVYRYLQQGTKAEAEKVAVLLRGKGYSVRLTKWGRSWAIYTRKAG